MGLFDNSFIVTLEAPALATDDDRGERAARALEQAMPGAPLVFEVGERNGRSTLLSRADDRASWLRAAAKQGGIPMLSTRDPDPLLFYADGHTVSFPSGESAQLAAVCQYPARGDAAARTPDLLAGLGQALRAYWGVATPFAAAAKIGSQVRPPGSNRQPPPGLPVLAVMNELAGSAVPQKLGWVNYWSAATAARLEFDPARDAEWLSRARQLDGGAWLLTVTAEPLDLDRRDHVEALAHVYARFREIGRAKHR